MRSGSRGRRKGDRLMELIQLIKVNPVVREVGGRVNKLTS
jgi:hypothetical protein